MKITKFNHACRYRDSTRIWDQRIIGKLGLYAKNKGWDVVWEFKRDEGNSYGDKKMFGRQIFVGSSLTNWTVSEQCLLLWTIICFFVWQNLIQQHWWLQCSKDLKKNSCPLFSYSSYTWIFYSNNQKQI